jgi:UDP-N-acetylglucosamine 2-epimerase
MAEIFFEQLGIGAPSYNLAIACGCRGAMSGRMLEAHEHIFVDESRDCVLVYGDVNSILAAKLCLPAKLDAQA